MRNRILNILTAALFIIISSCSKTPQYSVLIISGQGDNNNKASSESIKQILDETGLFATTVITAPVKGEDLPELNPNFAEYSLIVLDHDCDILPEVTNTALTDYINKGGGLVVCNSKYYQGDSANNSSTISERHDFEIRTILSDHPVTKGLPMRWVHPSDMIIQGLNPPSADSEVLATAYSDTAFSGSGRREPVFLTRNSGQGRIFTILIGVPDNVENQALHCSGFIVTLQRAAEWAATGSVTQEVPFDFPTAAGPVVRPGFKSMTDEEVFTNIGSYDISKSTKYFTFLQSMIRKASGDEEKLLQIEKKMVTVLKDPEATSEARKLLLRELSWMGTDYCIPAIKDLGSDPELTDDVEFALNRLQK